MARWWLVAAAAVGMLGGAIGVGCSGNAAEPVREPGPVRVVVSIPPLEGLCRALLPADAEVRVLVKPGRSPHGFEPTPADIAAVARADLVVLVGMGIESGLPRSAREGQRVLTMAGALGMDAGHADHEHGDHDHAHDHGEGASDPHLWLDPVLVGQFVPKLAERVRGALEATGAPAGDAEAVGAREAALAAEVGEIDREYRQALGGLTARAIITQHAGWYRLAERYGLEIAGVIQPGEAGEPTPGHIAGVIAAGREHGAVAVFGEVQLDAKLAERVAGQLGVALGRLDPLGGGDWAGMMRANLAALEGAMTPAPTAAPDGAGPGGAG